MKLSIVTTLYCSSPYIAEFYRRVVAAADQVVSSYELIFVDDGSPDDSLSIVIDIAKKDDRVKVIELSKNFGHHKAMLAGLEGSVGERVFLVDCDLEEPPESLIEFWDEIESNEGVDIVYGVNSESKEGSIAKRLASSAFYSVFNFFSYVKIPDNELVARLMTARYVKSLLSYCERDVFIPGIWADVGFNRSTVTVLKTFDGNSSYSLKKRLSMASDAVTSFSTKPLVYIFYFGLAMFLFSALTILYLIIRKLFFGTMLGGWTSLLASTYLIGGAIILSVGVIGVYVSRIFTEVKQRPRHIVKKVYRFDENMKVSHD